MKTAVTKELLYYTDDIRKVWPLLEVRHVEAILSSKS